MLLLQSWTDGEAPYLDLLPDNNYVEGLRLIARAYKAGREVRVYSAETGTLKMVYPDAEMVVVEESALIKK